MKITHISSSFYQKRGQGRIPTASVNIEAESDAERAFLQFAWVSKVKLYVYSNGNASLEMEMPRKLKNRE